MFTVMIDHKFDQEGSYTLPVARLVADAVAWDERCTVSVLNEAGNVVYEVSAF